jgi:hypothetical protein
MQRHCYGPFDKIGLQRFILSQGLIATLFIMAAVTNWMVPPIFAPPLRL